MACVGGSWLCPAELVRAGDWDAITALARAPRRCVRPPRYGPKPPHPCPITTVSPHDPTKFTKILSTLGPASAKPATIRALVEAGADVFRLNFSHGSHEQHREVHAMIRAVEAELGRPIGILMDLQGPKLRLGTFAEGKVSLPAGHRIRFDLDRTPGDATRVAIPHPEIIGAVSAGHELLIDDGKMRLTVVASGEGWVEAQTQTAGVLSDRKG